ncbi:MAG: DUF3857 domain-containing protein [Acidobacteria bacterium]|nr:DUF3857 domain-containing protein [Acidobacteriota bacterium]MBS1866331.1 DUF3857 domain-containing protein [Acidobacteriota bacterium]
MNTPGRLVCALILISMAAGAYGKQSSPAQEKQNETKPGEAKKESGHASLEPFVIEELSTKYTFEKDGKGFRETNARVSIKSESAVREFGLLVYPYASSFESLDIVHVRVRKPDGTVVETPASDVQDLDSAVSREAPMYSDEREKHIAVKSLSVGDTLELAVKWTVHDPLAPGHFWFDHSYVKSGNCNKETLEVNVPADVKPSIRFSNPQPVIREEGGRRIYKFETSYHKPDKETKISDWEKNYHGAEPPDVEFSFFSSWGEIADWAADLMEKKAVVTPEIQAKADELTKGKSTENEKVRAIYDFVSTHFRYIGVSLGIGRYSPHAAADVLTNRYGDCKDKHTLFAALLQASGISAAPVLISSKYKIDTRVPTPSLFDHVITAIRHGDSLEFADTTPEVAPFGVLMPGLMDRDALLVSKDGKLIKTPQKLPIPNYEIFSIDASIDTSGTLDGKMRMEERGEDEVMLRASYRETPQNRWEELTQNLVARLGFAGKVSEVTVSQPEDTTKPFVITCSYHRPDYPDWKTRRLSLPHPPLFIRELTEDQKASKEPLPIGMPAEVTYISKVKLPDGFSPIVPELVERKSKFIEFSASHSWEKGVLTSILKMNVLQGEIPGEERANFSSMAKLIGDTENKFVLLKGTSGDASPLALMGMMAPGEGSMIAFLEKAHERNPEDEQILMRLSNAYTKAGRAKEAVAMLQKSMGDHPDVPARLRLALGLAQLQVPDAEKAMMEFKAALNDAAEPEEFNEAGYALAEANTHLTEALDYSTHAVNKIESKSDEIDIDDIEANDFQLMPELAANWDTLGWIKFKMGEDQAAVKYLRAAWDLNQTSVIGEHLVEAYEKLGEKAKAAAICNMAKTTVLPGEETGAKLTQEMNRLRPFVKRTPGSGGISAAHPVDGALALSDLRLIEVPFHTKLQGNSAQATFLILLANGPSVKNVHFVFGAAELRGAGQALRLVKYPHTFPDDAPTQIMRMGTLTCTIYTKTCNLTLMPVSEAAAGASRNSYVVPQ